MSNIQIAGMDGLLQKLRALPAKVTTAVAAEIQDGAQSIAAEAKQRASGDQGILRNEIAAIKVDATTWQVVSGADYSPYVEFGTGEKVQIPAGLEEYAAQFKGDFSSGTLGAGSNLTAKEAIFNWCERKGIDKELWYPVYVSIMVHGTEPQPFFFPAAFRQEPIIVDKIKKALDDSI